MEPTQTPHDTVRTEKARPCGSVLANCWTRLACGELTVLSIHSDEDDYRLMLRENASGCGPTDKELGSLTRFALGDLQKVVAADLHCSLSRVAGAAARCLQRLGVRCQARALPMPLVMMIHAYYRAGSWAELTHASLVRGGPKEWVLNVSRPDTRLAAILSPGESEVIRLLIDGFSHAEIATSRGTSKRTVANQVARAYFRLDVSGRLELMGQLLSSQSSLEAS